MERFFLHMALRREIARDVELKYAPIKNAFLADTISDSDLALIELCPGHLPISLVEPYVSLMPLYAERDSLNWHQLSQPSFADNFRWNKFDDEVMFFVEYEYNLDSDQSALLRELISRTIDELEERRNSYNIPIGDMVLIDCMIDTIEARMLFKLSDHPKTKLQLLKLHKALSDLPKKPEGSYRADFGSTDLGNFSIEFSTDSLTIEPGYRYRVSYFSDSFEPLLMEHLKHVSADERDDALTLMCTELVPDLFSSDMLVEDYLDDDRDITDYAFCERYTTASQT